MLYATTRSKTDSYTSYRVMHEDCASDGGHFIPMRMPQYDLTQIEKITEGSFGDTVAQILNVFFSARLTGWDIDCCIGKSAVNISAISHRVLLAELWHNPKGDFSDARDKLFAKICGDTPECSASEWASIAIRIAFLFGIYNQLKKQDISSFDLTVNSGDFSVPMSAWYARKMGLPIDTIICVCNENSAPWDFLHRGELNTGSSVVHTYTQELDVAIPTGLERLVYETLGFDETKKFVECLQRKGVYHIRPDMIKQLSSGMYVSVVGKDRVESVISSIYRSNNCILDPYTAVSYGGLQDYRAKTGESNPTVLLWEKSPLNFLPLVQNATGLTKSGIEKHLI